VCHTIWHLIQVFERWEYLHKNQVNRCLIFQNRYNSCHLNLEYLKVIQLVQNKVYLKYFSSYQNILFFWLHLLGFRRCCPFISFKPETFDFRIETFDIFSFLTHRACNFLGCDLRSFVLILILILILRS